MVSGREPRLPPPPHKPTVEHLSGKRWWRVHTFDVSLGRYRSTAFNDSGRGDARFSPLVVDGKVVPTIYLANTKRVAIAEILLHEAPSPSRGWIYDWPRDKDPKACIHISQIRIPSVRCAMLTSLGLQAAGLQVADLVEGGAEQYKRTRDWAIWIHTNMPEAQGLFWMSRRDNQGSCLMLFGDRLKAGDALSEVSCRPVVECEAAVVEAVAAMGAGLASSATSQSASNGSGLANNWRGHVRETAPNFGQSQGRARIGMTSLYRREKR